MPTILIVIGFFKKSRLQKLKITLRRGGINMDITAMTDWLREIGYYAAMDRLDAYVLSADWAEIKIKLIAGSILLLIVAILFARNKGRAVSREVEAAEQWVYTESEIPTEDRA